MKSVISKTTALVSILVTSAALVGQGGGWVKLSPTKVPPVRSGHVMGYDVARDRVVVIGGIGLNSGNRIALGDTWEFDGSNWSNVTPTTTANPAPRWDFAGAYDSVRKVFVIFGGGHSRGSYSDTWEWNGARWTQVKPSAFPTKRQGHRMFFDLSLKKVVLFGGWNGSTKFGDTWSWDGKAWVKLSPKSSPSLRQAMGMAYDSKRKCGVLFGGVDEVNGGTHSDTWKWVGSNWAKSSATGPSKRASPGMASDEGGSQMVLFGGSNSGSRFDDTWTFDGAKWQKLTLSGPSPSPRYTPGLVYDSKRGRTLLFGGANSPTSFFADLWSLTINKPATIEVFGKGCASTTTLPTISGTPPKLGQNFTLQLQGFLPKPQFGQLIFGISNTKWGVIPLPLTLAVLGMGNCNLLVSLDASVLIVTDSQGSFKTTMKVPSSPSLLGAEVYGQAWAPDPKSNYAGVAMTNGFKAVVGY
jgi:Galactose oxidase, central domain